MIPADPSPRFDNGPLPPEQNFCIVCFLNICYSEDIGEDAPFSTLIFSFETRGLRVLSFCLERLLPVCYNERIEWLSEAYTQGSNQFVLVFRRLFFMSSPTEWGRFMPAH